MSIAFAFKNIIPVLLFLFIVRRQIQFLFSKIPSVDSTTLKKKIETDFENTVVIDVRTVGEFKTGHIDSAINIPVGQIKDRSGEIKARYSGKKIFLICASGMRSRQAAVTLKEENVKNIFNVSSGMSRWN